MGTVSDCCDCTDKPLLLTPQNRLLERTNMFTRVEKFDVLMFQEEEKTVPAKQDELRPLKITRKSQYFEIERNNSFKGLNEQLTLNQGTKFREECEELTLLDRKNFVKYRSERKIEDCYDTIDEIAQGKNETPSGSRLRGHIMRDTVIPPFLIKYLGGGGRVEKVRHRLTGAVRAAKYIKIRKGRDFSRAENQIQILKETDHPNILKIHEYFSEGKHIIIVTEFIEGETLEVERKGKLTDQEIAEVMRQLLSALCYLHTRGTIHADVKPANIIVQRQAASITIKLIDFGISHILRGRSKSIHELSGTHGFMAPQHQDGEVECKSDVWAAGATLYQLISGKLPHQGQEDLSFSVSDIAQPLFREEIWTKTDTGAINLAKLMLQNEAGKRPTSQEAVQHYWLQEAKKQYNSSHEVQKQTYESMKKLLHFDANNIIQKAVMLYLASNQFEELTSIRKLLRAFYILDSDEDGAIGENDLIKAFIKSGMSKKQAEIKVIEVFSKVDLNKNALIDYTQFLAANLDFSSSEDLLKNCFQTLDTNGNGYLELRQIVDWLFPWWMEWNDAQLKSVDLRLIQSQYFDRKGRISLENFLSVVKGEGRIEGLSHLLSHGDVAKYLQ